MANLNALLEIFSPEKNMERFTLTMLSIFQRFGGPSDEEMDCEKPDGQGDWNQYDGQQHKPFKEELEMAVDLNTCNNTFTDLAAKKAQETLDVMLTPIADKQELEMAVDLNTCNNTFTDLDFRNRHLNDIQTKRNNGSYCCSLSPTSQSKQCFTDLQKDLHECTGNYSLSYKPPEVRHQQCAEENGNQYITPADEETDVNDSSLGDSYIGFTDICRKANRSFAYPLGNEQAQFCKQSNRLSKRRSLKRFKKHLNSSASSNFSLVKCVSATTNWCNVRPMSRYKRSSSCSTAVKPDGKNEVGPDICLYGNTKGVDKQPQTTSIQPTKLVDKNTANDAILYAKFRYKKAQSPRFIYPHTPIADFHCSENTQSPTLKCSQNSNSTFQQDFHCTWKSLSSTAKSPQISNVTFLQKDLGCLNKTDGPTSNSPQASKAAFLLEGFDCSDNTYNSASNSLHPLNEQEDSSLCEQADQYGLRSLQPSIQNERNKTFLMRSLDSYKTDNVRNTKLVDKNAANDAILYAKFRYKKAQSPRFIYPHTPIADFHCSEKTQSPTLKCSQNSNSTFQQDFHCTWNERNKTFLMRSLDSYKTDNVRNKQAILPTVPTMMQTISGQNSAPDQPGQAENNIANVNCERRSTLPNRLVLPCNLKKQLSFKIQEKESDFDKIYKELCMNNCLKLPTSKKAYAGSETPDCSEGGIPLTSPLFYKKRKSDLPNDNSSIPSAKRLRDEHSDSFKEVCLFPQEHKIPPFPVNAESRLQASHMENDANLQLKLPPFSPSCPSTTTGSQRWESCGELDTSAHFPAPLKRQVLQWLAT